MLLDSPGVSTFVSNIYGYTRIMFFVFLCFIHSGWQASRHTDMGNPEGGGEGGKYTGHFAGSYQGRSIWDCTKVRFFERTGPRYPFIRYYTPVWLPALPDGI